MSSEEMDEMDTQAYIFDGETYQEDREHEIVSDASWSNVSGGELLRQARMTQAENIMRSSGWLDKLQDDIENIQQQTMPKLNINQDHTASDWRNILESRHQEILQDRKSVV